jgi:hypothetical protein
LRQYIGFRQVVGLHVDDRYLGQIQNKPRSVACSVPRCAPPETDHSGGPWSFRVAKPFRSSFSSHLDPSIRGIMQCMSYANADFTELTCFLDAKDC